MTKMTTPKKAKTEGLKDVTSMANQPLPPDTALTLPPTPNLKTTPEAAAYLTVQPTILEQWRWHGRGPPIRKNRKILQVQASRLGRIS